MTAALTLSRVREHLASLGVVIQQAPGEYLLFLKGRPQETAERIEGLAEALDRGRELFQEQLAEIEAAPPRKRVKAITQRQTIRAHNRTAGRIQRSRALGRHIVLQDRARALAEEITTQQGKDTTK